MMVHVRLRTRERNRDGRTRAILKNAFNEEKRGWKMHGPYSNCQGPVDGRSGRGGKSGESSVNSIRIALVYIRGQDSPRAILPSRISTARRADYVRGRGIDGTPFSRGRV